MSSDICFKIWIFKIHFSWEGNRDQELKLEVNIPLLEIGGMSR